MKIFKSLFVLSFLLMAGPASIYADLFQGEAANAESSQGKFSARTRNAQGQGQSLANARTAAPTAAPFLPPDSTPPVRPSVRNFTGGAPLNAEAGGTFPGDAGTEKEDL